jgi:hypothetical protein
MTFFPTALRFKPAALARALTGAASITILSATHSIAQTAFTNPQALAHLVTTACLFDTPDPDAELPRSHMAFKAAGLAIVTEGPHMGFYGDPSRTYFISNLTDDDNVGCAAVILLSDLDKNGFDLLTLSIEAAYRARYGAHVFAPKPGGTDRIARHPDGTRTQTPISFHQKTGTRIASITFPPE